MVVVVVVEVMSFRRVGRRGCVATRGVFVVCFDIYFVFRVVVS